MARVRVTWSVARVGVTWSVASESAQGERNRALACSLVHARYPIDTLSGGELYLGEQRARVGDKVYLKCRGR